jgi:hypothetical protein
MKRYLIIGFFGLFSQVASAFLGDDVSYMDRSIHCTVHGQRSLPGAGKLQIGAAVTLFLKKDGEYVTPVVSLPGETVTIAVLPFAMPALEPLTDTVYPGFYAAFRDQLYSPYGDMVSVTTVTIGPPYVHFSQEVHSFITGTIEQQSLSLNCNLSS